LGVGRDDRLDGFEMVWRLEAQSSLFNGHYCINIKLIFLMLMFKSGNSEYSDRISYIESEQNIVEDQRSERMSIVPIELFG